MTGKFASINDINLYYEIHGQGEPLVLLHGFTGSSSSWGQLGTELAKEFQLIIPDLRGHGRSTNNRSDYTFRQVAFDIYALLDTLKLKKIKCLGCSGGSSALLHMAIQQPDRIDSMVLISATSHYPDQARAIMAQTSIDALNEEQWQSLRKVHVHGEGQIRKLYEHVKGFATDYSDVNFTKEDLATILAQTLIVHGDRDFLFPVDIPIEMYKAISKSSLWIVPNADHGPITDENMPYFIETVKRFLKP